MAPRIDEWTTALSASEGRCASGSRHALMGRGDVRWGKRATPCLIDRVDFM
jgi:hypothetical protein